MLVEMAKKPSKIKGLESRKKKKLNESDDNYSADLSSEGKSTQIVNTVPIMQEEFSISKKSITENIKVEKRWNSTTKKIEVPVSFEEVYINGKDLKAYGKEDDNIISELNKRIIKSFEDMDDAKKKQYSILEKMNLKERWFLYLMLMIRGFIISMTSPITKQKKVIPILGEEIIVNKRIIKLGELILAKNKVTENQKIAADTIKEKATIRYPDGSTNIL